MVIDRYVLMKLKNYFGREEETLLYMLGLM